MTTLRRELRVKFEEVLARFSDKLTLPEREPLADLLADAALELRGFKLIEGAGIDWAILAGQDITQEQVKQIQLRDVAPKMFEKALGFSKPLPWWSDKDWTAFGEWVCTEYDKDKMSFGEYNIWRSNQYSSGKLANTTIRSYPDKFYDSWDMFMMSKPKKTDETRPEYQPFPFAGDA